MIRRIAIRASLAAALFFLALPPGESRSPHRAEPAAGVTGGSDPFPCLLWQILTFRWPVHGGIGTFHYRWCVA